MMDSWPWQLPYTLYITYDCDMDDGFKKVMFRLQSNDV